MGSALVAARDHAGDAAGAVGSVSGAGAPVERRRAGAAARVF
jgi:hypothetical protein